MFGNNYNQSSKRAILKENNTMRWLLRQWYGSTYGGNEITAYQCKSLSVAENVGKIAEGALSAGMLQFAKISEEWKSIVGEQLAMFIAPVALQEKCLLIEVNHSAWMREMNGRPGQMLKEKIQKKFPDITEIRFVPAGRRRKD